MAVIEFYRAGIDPVLIATANDSVVPPKGELIEIGGCIYEVLLVNWKLPSISRPISRHEPRPIYIAVHLEIVRSAPEKV